MIRLATRGENKTAEEPHPTQGTGSFFVAIFGSRETAEDAGGEASDGEEAPGPRELANPYC